MVYSCAGNPFSCRCGEGKAGRMTDQDSALVQEDLALKGSENLHKKKNSNVTSRIVNGYAANIKYVAYLPKIPFCSVSSLILQ